MSCFMTGFKNHLETLSHEKQLHVINHVINQFNKSNRPGENIVKIFRILNELKILKKRIIFNNKEYLQKYLQKYYSELL